MNQAHINNSNINNEDIKNAGDEEHDGTRSLPPRPMSLAFEKPRSGSMSLPRKPLPAVPKRNIAAVPQITIAESAGSSAQKITNPAQPPENDDSASLVPRLNPENISLEKNKKRVSTLMSKLVLTILRHETIQDKKPYTFFHIQVQSPQGSWNVMRRYSQLYELHKKLEPHLSKEFPNFPSKTIDILVDNLSEEFLQTRQSQLQIYLMALCGSTKIVENTELLEYLLNFLDPNVKRPAITLTDAAKKGYLNKLSSKSIGGVTVPKVYKRYYILQGSQLYYYETDKSSEPRQILDLTCAGVEVVPSKKDKCHFEISMGTKSKILFADSEEDMKDWVVKLRQSRMKADPMNDQYLAYIEHLKDETDDSIEVDGGNRDTVVSVDSQQDMRGTMTDTIGGTMSASPRPTDPSVVPRGPGFRRRTEVSKTSMIDFTNDVPDTIDQLVLNEDGTIKAATMPKLIQKLFDPDYNDPNYIKAFLVSFHSFTSPDVLVKQLAVQFLKAGMNKEKEHKIKARILLVLTTWIDFYPHDLIADQSMREDVLELLDANVMQFDRLAQTLVSLDSSSSIEEGPSSPQVSRPKWSDMFKKKLEQSYYIEYAANNAPVSVVPSLFESGSFDFFDLDPIEVARQLTLIELRLLKNIHLKEFLNVAWTRKDKLEKAPGIISITQRFNMISAWTSSYIVRPKQAQLRGGLISRFIDIANETFKLQNFSSTMQIISGLSNCAVHRLEESWKYVADEKKSKFTELLKFFDSPDACKSAMGSAPLPAIPFLGMYLTDLVFIEEAGKMAAAPSDSFGMISFAKNYKILRVINAIQRSQMCQYNIRPVQQIQDYLMNLTTIDDNQIYQISLQLEARKNKSGANNKQGSTTPTPRSSRSNNFGKQIALLFGWTKKK